MSKLLDEVVRAQKRGEKRGITSICSAHPWVLKAAMQGNGKLLIESTCNQVNQHGGYTGMTPVGFIDFVQSLAAENGFPREQIILGGDHLGPSVWQHEPATTAMQKSEQLVHDYVQAGYTKIHLDASMKLADDDPSQPLPVEVSAQRSARLAKVAENANAIREGENPLRYVIGSEVPPPGGSTAAHEAINVTRVDDARHMLEATQAAFTREGLEAAWERVIALVVQPGVEFGHDFIQDYHPTLAHDLCCYAETIPFVYEAHSTDYQTRENLRNLVQDHFAILKVGPALTFAFREAAFSLAMIEKELLPLEERSNLIEILDETMRNNPAHWIHHYRGNDQVITLARRYSLSDRIRYYWAQPAVQAAFSVLLNNLGGKPIPLPLLGQYSSRHYAPIREGRLPNSAEAILTESVRWVLRDYDYACETMPEDQAVDQNHI